MPFIGNDGKLIQYDTSYTDIYYFGSQILYHIPILMFKLDSSMQSLMPYDTGYGDLVLSDGNKSGWYIDRINATEKIVSNDSLFQTIPIYMNSINEVLFKNKINLITKKDKGRSLVEETYSAINLDDTSKKSMITVDYSKKVHFDKYSLSSKMDSIKGMKMVKIHMLHYPRFFKEAGIYIDGAEVEYELSLIDEINEAELLPLFKKEKEMNLK